MPPAQCLWLDTSPKGTPPPAKKGVEAASVTGRSTDMEMENALKAPARSPAAGKSRNSSGGPSAGRKGGREAMELCFHLLFLLCGVVAVAFVLFISIYLIVSGLPAIR